MRNLDELFAALAQSRFRSRFHLGPQEQAIVAQRGREVVEAHARDLIAQRLAPAEIHNDGKQTPMRGHPVFIAQHATATCCRGCLAKWHHIEAGRVLSEAEQAHVIATIMRWIDTQPVAKAADPAQPSLF
jgi:hypothetical protein